MANETTYEALAVQREQAVQIVLAAINNGALSIGSFPKGHQARRNEICRYIEAIAKSAYESVRNMRPEGE